MVTQAVAHVEVVVAASPEEAFRIFTEEINSWWRTNSRYWNDSKRALYLLLEPHVAGRFIEVYDANSNTGFEVGRVTAWEPGRRLGLTWTQRNWPEGVATEIGVTFEPAGEGTRVRLQQTGFERLGPEGPPTSAGYQAGWTELLGWFAERVTSSPTKGGTEYFFYKLIPPRPTFAQDMTEAEARVMQKHSTYWKDLTNRGIAVVYGPVSDPRGGWGMAIVKVQNEAEARALGLNDPSVRANLSFEFEIYPMPLGA